MASPGIEENHLVNEQINLGIAIGNDEEADLVHQMSCGERCVGAVGAPGVVREVQVDRRPGSLLEALEADVPAVLAVRSKTWAIIRDVPVRW